LAVFGFELLLPMVSFEKEVPVGMATAKAALKRSLAAAVDRTLGGHSDSSGSRQVTGNENARRRSAQELRMRRHKLRS
jgi:hypothetical protein